jgi:hypothetical protein
LQQATIDHDATTHAGAEDHREHHRRTGGGAIGSLGHGQAIGIVG